MASPGLDEFEVLTFDCYGTLIDWETGILAALRDVLDGYGASADDEALLQLYARFEAETEAGPYLPYLEVRVWSLRGVSTQLGSEATAAETRRFSESGVSKPRWAETPRSDQA